MLCTTFSILCRKIIISSMNVTTLPHRQLSEDFDCYKRSFQVFIKSSVKRDVSTSLVDDLLTSRIGPKLKENAVGNEEELRILGVGSGTGRIKIYLKYLLMQCFLHNSIYIDNM